MEKPWLKDFEDDVAKWRPKWEALYDEGVPCKPVYPDVPMRERFLRCVDMVPDKTYLIWRDSKLTYKESNKICCQLANALLELGVKKGDRVAIMLPNVPPYVMAIHALFKIGAIEVPCNHMYTAVELGNQFKDSGSETVITIAPHAEKAVAALRDSGSCVKRVVVVQLPGYEKEVEQGEGIYDYDAIVNSAKDSEPDVELSPSDIVRLQYTGGTTGVPKGCVLTSEMVMTQQVRTSEWFRPGVLPENFITLCAIPMNHIYGYNGNVNICMYEGGTIVLVDVPTPDVLLETITKHKPNIFAAVPAMIIGLVNHPDIGKSDISSLTGIFSGSAPLAVSTLQKFEELTGGKIVEGYGMSETINVLTLNPMFRMRKFGSCGMVWPDTSLVVVDVETGTKVMPRGELGELIAKGPQNITDYWNKPDETAETVRDGWLYTGDIVYIDEDGFIFIMDRKKDMIIVNGFNVYPRDIDEVMFSHPKVVEACTVGIPDEKQGEAVKVFVVMKPGETMTPEEVFSYCREQLAPYKVPRFVEFIDAVPRTSVGKPDRKVLQAQELAKMK
mgnify:FL=1